MRTVLKESELYKIQNEWVYNDGLCEIYEVFEVIKLRVKKNEASSENGTAVYIHVFDVRRFSEHVRKGSEW